MSINDTEQAPSTPPLLPNAPAPTSAEPLRLAFEAWWQRQGYHRLDEATQASVIATQASRSACWLAWLEGQSYGIEQAQAIYISR